jgi:hypothetical protein
MRPKACALALVLTCACERRVREQPSPAVGFISIPLGTFTGATAGAFVGDRIDKH